MAKWNITNNRGGGVPGYRFYATLYSFPDNLSDPDDIVWEIRKWIREDIIDAKESIDDFTWYFKNEYDRMTLLLIWG